MATLVVAAPRRDSRDQPTHDLSRHRPSAWLLLVLLLGLAIRAVELDALRLAGDSAYSVYVAGQPLLDITIGRISDGHPPLYYWLLHAATVVFGTSELAVRYPSVLVGALLPALAWAAGRRIGGVWVGLLASALVAAAPFLVHYSREPRMYSLFATISLASMLLLDAALGRGGGRRWLAYGAVTLIALWTHYYALPLLLGQALYVALCHRRQLWTAVPVQLLIAIGFAPWLLFATLSQARATAGVISNAPPAVGLLGFLEQIWTPFHVGVGLDWRVGGAVGVVAALGWLGLLVLGRQSLTPVPPLVRLLLFVSAAVIAQAFVLFLIAPYALHARFLICLLPVYLVLLAWALGRTTRARLAGILVVLFILHGVTLAATIRVGLYTQENDAIFLADRLAALAQPGDALAIQAAWHLGYLASHLDGVPLAHLPLASEGQPPGSLNDFQRVWLAIYGDGRHVNPWEVWLDDHWGRAAAFDAEQSHLLLYARPPDQVVPLTVGFVDASSGREQLRLAGAGVPPTLAHAGDTLAVALRWRAPEGERVRLTPFLHLVDSTGQRVAGADDEPRNGFYPVVAWGAGEEVHDARALLLPLDLAPGTYALVLGVYPTGGGQRLRPDGVLPSELPSFPDVLTLGRVSVARAERVPALHPVETRIGPDVWLTGWRGELDRFDPIALGSVQWTSVDNFPLNARRTWLRAGQSTDVILRLRIDAPLVSPIELRARFIGGSDGGSGSASLPAGAASGERLVVLRVPVPSSGPARLVIEGPAASVELGAFDVDP